MPLQSELCDIQTKRVNPVINPNGDPVSGDAWVAVFLADCKEDTPACNNDGRGWVQIGDLEHLGNRICKSHKQHYGTNPVWGTTNGNPAIKSKTIWCELDPPTTLTTTEATTTTPASTTQTTTSTELSGKSWFLKIL